MNQTKHIHVTSIEAAWAEADRIFPTDYLHDSSSSRNAGYDVYRSTSTTLPHAFYNYICDLGNRLELNLTGADWEPLTVNIWIDEPEPEPEEVLGVQAYPVPADDAEKAFEVRLANGSRIVIKEEAQAPSNGVWPWKVGTQFFSERQYAKAYLQTLIGEKLTGKRMILHPKKAVPVICGVDGAACRCRGECRSMLCSDCPVAEAFFADRDGVELVYAVR